MIEEEGRVRGASVRRRNSTERIEVGRSVSTGDLLSGRVCRSVALDGRAVISEAPARGSPEREPGPSCSFFIAATVTINN